MNLFFLTLVVMLFSLYVFMTVKCLRMLIIPAKRQELWVDMTSSFSKIEDPNYIEFVFTGITIYYWIKTAFVAAVVLTYLKPWPLALGGAGLMCMFLAASSSQTRILRQATVARQEISPLTTPMTVLNLIEDSAGTILLGLVLAQTTGVHF